MTASSPVHGISNLVLWLETSSDESISSDQVGDGSQIYRWDSIGNQQTQKYYAIKTATANVTYKESSPIGSLPSIYFNGTTSTNNYFTISTNTSSSGSTYIPTPNCNFSYFLVYRPDLVDSASNRYVIYNGTSANNNGYGYYFLSNYRRLVFTTINTPAVGGMVTDVGNEVISMVYNSSQIGTTVTSQPYKTTLNGSEASATVSCKQPDSAAFFQIGFGRNATLPWAGYISEIIFFDRALKDEERNSIRSYLAQKYSLPT